MTRAVSENLTYNEKGNEVRFEIRHPGDAASATPALLENMKAREVKEGEVIFRQGEPGHFLYYIAMGRYDVIVNDRCIATLTPEDLFLGEMSFLLSHHRSATVRARTAGRLIEISRRRFVEAIKRKPHYALVLSRVLANKLDRQGIRAAGRE